MIRFGNSFKRYIAKSVYSYGVCLLSGVVRLSSETKLPVETNQPSDADLRSKSASIYFRYLQFYVLAFRETAKVNQSLHVVGNRFHIESVVSFFLISNKTMQATTL